MRCSRVPRYFGLLNARGNLQPRRHVRFLERAVTNVSKVPPLAEVDAASLGVDITPRLRVLTTTEPAVRSAGVRLSNAAELAEKLRAEGVV